MATAYFSGGSNSTHHIVRVLGLIHSRAAQLNALLDKFPSRLRVVPWSGVSTSATRSTP